MKNKWKEKTKLNSIEIKEIIVEALLAIICIVLAIIEKNGIWFLTAGLEIVIAIQIYCNAKLLKAKQAIIDLKDKEIVKQRFINKTLEEVGQKNFKMLLNTSTRYNDLIQESLNKADTRFENAKQNYVHNKIHISKLSEAQGYYQALVDLQKKVEKNMKAKEEIENRFKHKNKSKIERQNQIEFKRMIENSSRFRRSNIC